MKVPANCRRIGRWRIVEADLWDRAHLDLCGPARLTITAQGGEIAFGALEAGLEVEYARDPLVFTRPAARKATRSMAKEPPNFSTTAPSRSSSSTQTATKPSSKRNGTLLQQPASEPPHLTTEMKGGAKGAGGAHGAPIEIVMSTVSIVTVEQGVSPPTTIHVSVGSMAIARVGPGPRAQLFRASRNALTRRQRGYR